MEAATFGHLGSCWLISSITLLSCIQNKCMAVDKLEIESLLHVAHLLTGCMSLQVKVAIDGQGEYEVEEGKHFYFSVADHLRRK